MRMQKSHLYPSPELWFGLTQDCKNHCATKSVLETAVAQRFRLVCRIPVEPAILLNAAPSLLNVSFSSHFRFVEKKNSKKEKRSKNSKIYTNESCESLVCTRSIAVIL